ncbi:MAG: hypothetical protein HRU38_11040 [Saccharospirillaceae bacterium]|nr:hypothetical protein [Saccharospirillaceae bacterium]
MSALRDNLAELLSLKAAINEAIKSQRRSDKCHDNFIKRTNTVGFSRASTTTYTANAAWNAEALKSDMKHLKGKAKDVLNID